MIIFKNKWFSRFARRQRISDQDLCNAIARAERGLLDADLGGGVIKQRIPRPNEGRSGGYRSIILFLAGEAPFLSLALLKTIWTTSAMTIWMITSARRKLPWLWMKRC